MPTTSFTISTQQLLRLVEELDGETLNLVTVGVWHRQGIASASFPCVTLTAGHRYTLADVARVRLVARLRRDGVSMQKVRIILAHLGDQLRHLLKPGSKAEILVDGKRGAVIVREPGRPDRELPGGQLRLKLSEVLVDEKTAAKFAA